MTNLLKPLVTVVIPCFNYQHKVGRAIQSARDQDLNNIEIIVVDDGSDDEQAIKEAVENASIGKKTIIENEEKREVSYRDMRVRLIRQNNSGVAVARNRGISEGTAPYVCCLDADDAIEPNLLTICVDGLERDRSLGIAYTGLKWVKPDRTEGISPWPSTFNYEHQLQRQNQIPTCCVFRKKMWERLGGYRKRYCPKGAGQEDAEFWTRCGAYGWNAAQITSAPLFIYSLGTGYVTSQLGKGHKEVDWLAWHPWAKDGRHPFASIAKPQNHSHPVRQYDDPIVSVVIPVGPGHDEVLLDALDSLEAQTLRRWEAIVVIDGAFHGVRSAVDQFMSDKFYRLKKAYPYVNWLVLSDGPHGKGAGLARNFGANRARSPFLLFLDADDYLMPDALEKMVDAWKYEEAIIYTDYVGVATVEDPDKLTQEQKDKLYYWEEGKAIIGHQSFDYSPGLAQKQPQGDRPYIWTNVTSLIPKEWHDEIGGFDETMESWEDVDYHWRMARAGKCYIRIPEELLVYRFDTGVRREHGRQEHVAIVEYLTEKYKEIEVVACGCKETQYKPTPTLTRGTLSTARAQPKGDKSVDGDMIRAKYLHPNRGQHRVLGGAEKIDYGYRAGGDIFLVHKNDIASQPHLFQAIEPIMPAKPKPAPSEPPVIAETPPPIAVAPTTDVIDDLLAEPDPIPVVEEVLPKEEVIVEIVQDFDFQTLPGVTNDIASQFEANGLKTLEDIVALGIEGLQKYKGIAKVRGEQISTAAKQLAKAQG